MVLFGAEKHSSNEVGRGDAWSAFDDFEASERTYDAVTVLTGGIWDGGVYMLVIVGLGRLW